MYEMNVLICLFVILDNYIFNQSGAILFCQAMDHRNKFIYLKKNRNQH